MAVIGDLVATLSLNNSKFDKGVRDSRTSLQKLQSGIGDVGADLARMGKQFALFGAAAGAAFAGLAVKVISATKEQQAAFAQLERGVALSAGRVGRSIQELQAEAARLQSITLFGDDQIIEAQARLLSFQNITEGVFDRATVAALDLSTRMGTDLNSAVLQLGKALQDPATGLTALTRSGTTFTEQQKEMVKQLVDSGRTIEAQTFILDELEKQYKGSAEAARNTLGGALTGLKNAFGDLFEAGPTEQAEELRLSIEQLTTTISSPEFVAGAQAFAGAVLDVTVGIAQLVGEIPQAISFLGDLRAALGLGGEAGTVAGIELQIDRLNEQLVGLRNQERAFGEGTQGAMIAQVEAEIASLVQRQQELLASQTQQIAKSGEVAKAATTEASAIKTVTASTTSNAAAIKKANAERERQRKAIQDIVDANNPLLAQQRKLVSQIALLEKAIKSERGSTDELTKAKTALEEQLASLRNPLVAVTEAHKQNVEQLTAELDAIKGGAAAYDAFLAQKKIDEETQRIINDLLADGHELRDLNTQAIRDQVREEQALITQIEKEKDAREDANRAWEALFTEILGSLLDSTGSMGDAFADLASRMKREVLNAGVGAVSGLGTSSTPILSGVSQLLGLGGGGGSLEKLFSNGSLFPGVEANVLNLSNQLVAQGGVLADAGLALNNAANSLAELPGGFVGGSLLSAGAGFAGGQLGQMVFGGEAGIGSQLGGLGGAALGAQFGALGGPLGAFAGSFVGSAIDKVFGGDGPETRAAVFAGSDTSRAEPKWVVDLRDAASGLKLAGEAQRVGAEGQQAVAGMVETFAQIDQALTSLTRASGLSVDLSGATGFGSFSGQDAGRDFVRKWIDAVSDPFDAELKSAADALVGDTAEDLINAYQGLLTIRDSIAAGGIFAGLGSLQQLSQAVGPAQVQQIAAFAAQIKGLKQVMTTDSVAAWEQSQRTVFELWRDQGDAIVNAAEVAASTEDFAVLTAAVQERYATEQQLIGQIMGALQSAADQFGNSYESIFVDGLKTEQERYDFFRKQADSIAEMITTLNDPAAISAAASEYNANLMNAYSSLSEASQDAMRADILATTEQVGALVQERLNMALENIEADGRADVPGSVGNVIEAATDRAMENIRRTVTEAVEAVSKQQAETSRQSTELVNSLNQWAANLPENISVQLAGSEVAF